MKHGKTFLAPLFVMALGVAVGCTSSIAGSPRLSAKHLSSASATTTDSPSGGPAPDVPKPLNVKPYLGRDVCYIIGKKQARAIGVGNPRAKPYNSREGAAKKYDGPICSINPRNQSNRITGDELIVGFTPHYSLDDIYNRIDHWQYFTSGEAHHYPYVLGNATDHRSQGVCTLHLAVTDKITSDMSYYDKSKNGKNACDLVKKTADEVVTTLKKTK